METEKIMNTFEKMFYALDLWRMEKAEMYGWFHLMWLAIMVVAIVLISVFRKKISPKAIDITLIVWGVVLILLEAVKLILYSFHYNDGVVSWSFDWGSFPFQFCSTPLYVAIPAGIIRRGKIKDSLLSFLAIFALFGGLIAIVFPSGLFVERIFISVHTMIWHGSMVVMGVMLWVTKRVEAKWSTLFKAFIVFMIMVSIAMLLNLCIGTSLGWFNLFYISPYYRSTLVVFEIIWDKAPYPIFLLCYIVGFTIAGTLVFLAAKGIGLLALKIQSKIKRSA